MTTMKPNQHKNTYNNDHQRMIDMLVEEEVPTILQNFLLILQKKKKSQHTN